MTKRAGVEVGARLLISCFVLLPFIIFDASAAVARGPRSETSYDFIVVGGGTAGVTVASRLSQLLPDVSVLVIEAGPAAPDEAKINNPGLKGSTIGTSYDWNLTTVPQTSANARVLTQPRAKVLGGSSAMNLMVWDRASREEYDSWERLGTSGWNWDSMYKAMLKVENYVPSNGTYGQDGVAEGGVIQTLINRCIPSWQDAFIPTMENLGVENNLESLNGNPLGVALQPSNMQKGNYKRSYSAYNPGYPSIAGAGLEIWTSSEVAKVNLEYQKGTIIATGITLENGTVISATREVIISAGSLQSPGILERSGIGNSTLLTNLGIPTFVDLPGVGENLQDHIRIQTAYQLKPNYTSLDSLRYNASYAAEQLALYNDGQCSRYDYTGSTYLFATWDQALNGTMASTLRALARSAASTPITPQPVETLRSEILLSYLEDTNSSVPEVEVILSDGYNGVKGYPAVNSSLYGSDFFALITAFQHPLSLGSVHIGSASGSAKPLINPNYLAQEYDIEALVAAVKYTRRIANTPPLSDLWRAAYEPDPSSSSIPSGPESYETDAYDTLWRDYVMKNFLTIYHPAGSCAMLPREVNGVVDSELKVWGTENVRVVDASIMPLLVSAHIQTAVYGIAERAAAMVASAWS